MTNRHSSYSRRERGVVLLLALITLLLISAVAAAILFMAASESSLVGYQRNNTRSYDAGLGGLDEGRVRLSTGDPSFIGDPVTATIPFPLLPTDVLYVLNPIGGEVIDPTDINSNFYDWNYDMEWGAGALAAATVQTVNSDMIALAVFVTLPEIAYKWVRITILSEQAAGRDIDGNGVLNNVIPVTWNASSSACYSVPPGACLYQAVPDTMNIINNPAILDRDLSGAVELDERIGRLVYRITALARTAASGATRMLQYDVGAPIINADFPSAISLMGTGATCGSTPGNDPNNEFGSSNAFRARGQDQAPGALPGAGGPAIGCTDPATCADYQNEMAGPPNRSNNWSGNDGTPATRTGDVTATANPGISTTAGLEDLISDIRNAADQVFTAADPPPNTNVDPTDDTVILPPGTNLGNCNGGINQPMVTVIEGDVDLGNASGCGILLVTGDLDVRGNTSWKGVVLVIGEGRYHMSGGGNGGVEGAILLARIYCDESDVGVDPNCPALPTTLLDPPAGPGPSGAAYTFNGGGTADMNFNSFWINNAIGGSRFQVLAYREISPP